MYICMKCKRTFDTPCNQHDDIGYTYSVCPYCEDDRIEEATPCKQCSDPKPNDHEKYCDSCKKGIKDDIWDLHNVAGWDRELLLDAMEAILNE